MFERLRVLLLITGAVTLPLFFLPITPADQFLIPKQSLLSFLACITLIIGFYPVEKLFQNASKNSLLSALFFLSCIAISIIGSTNYHAGLNELKMWAYLIILFLTATQINWDICRLGMLMKISIIVSSIVAISIILEYFMVIPFYTFPFSLPSSAGKLYSFFGYRNIAAQYLIVTVIWGFVLTVISTDSKTRIIALTCTLLSGTALLLTFCRGAIISTVFGLGLFLFYYNAQNIKGFKKIRLIQIVYMLLITIVAVLFLSNALSDGKTSRQISTLLERGDSERFIRWKDSVNMIYTNPIAGVGLGNYSIVYPMFKTGKWSHHTVYAHNEFLQIAAETGVVGSIGFIVFLIITFKRSRQQIVDIFEAEEKFLHLAILFSCVATLVHSIFSYNLHSATSSFFFFVGLGILCASKWSVTEKLSFSGNNLTKNIILLSIVVLMAFLGIYGEYKRIKGHYHFNQAISSIKNNDNVASIKHFTKAIKFQPDNFKYHVMISSTYRIIGNTKLSNIHFQKANKLSPYHYNSIISNK